MLERSSSSNLRTEFRIFQSSSHFAYSMRFEILTAVKVLVFRAIWKDLHQMILNTSCNLTEYSGCAGFESQLADLLFWQFYRTGLESWKCSCGIRCADHMSTQYRLVQSGKTASGGCSAGPRVVRAVAPRIIYLLLLFIIRSVFGLEFICRLFTTPLPLLGNAIKLS
jgi:hypothetical protein